MDSIVIRVDPTALDEPNLDLRYHLPDLLVARSHGNLTDDGYDYCGETHALLIYMAAKDLKSALSCVIQVVEGEVFAGNALRHAVIVGVKRGDAYDAVYPLGSCGTYPQLGRSLPGRPGAAQ